MTAPILNRHRPPTGHSVAPAPEMALLRGRLHEMCGPARRTAALWLAGAMQGPVLWIAPGWGAEGINPCGMVQWVDPGRFVFAGPNRDEDILWCMEEALRSGAMALVVADLRGPPGLVPVRRLHLAAQSSGATPLGLILTPGNGGAPGVESRWHTAPDHRDRQQVWRLERRRARTLPPKAWAVHGQDGQICLTPNGAPDD